MREPVWDVNDKLLGRRFAEAHGIATAPLLGVWDSPEEVERKLARRHRPGLRCFAEAFLTGSDGSVPFDVKVFAFYGEVGLVEVRTGDWSRAAPGTEHRNRAFRADGTEVIGGRPFIRRSPEIPPPRDLPAVVEAASRLSRAIRRPAVRLDFFETDEGLFFGEVTPNPGHVPVLRGHLDRELGAMFERAQARLLADLVAEGTLFVEHGAG